MTRNPQELQFDLSSDDHAMETRLDDVRKGAASVTPQLIEALLKALDVLKVLRHEVETRVAADVDVEAAAAAVERRSALRTPTTRERRRSKKTTAPPAGATHRVEVVAPGDHHLRVTRTVAILTGMGQDGAAGAARVHQAGGFVMVEDESTCVVYGMPRAVVERGVADRVVPLDQVAEAIAAGAPIRA